MTARLQVRGQSEQDAGDIVFWIQTRKYLKGRNTLILEGIDKGGVDDWSGKLPATGEYEIYVSNPPYNDHTVKHKIHYILQVSIK
jgi:hypothetical protein